jgi:Dolichyl-phosphate-mannose-protein mannosyltransferase
VSGADWKRRAARPLGLVLAVMTTAIVLANQHEVGLARDEIVYMQSGMRYADWWIGLVTLDHGVSRQDITRTFGGAHATDNNREHPPLMKTLFGLSHRLAHRVLGVDEVTAFRLPSAILHGVAVWLVYALTCAVWGMAEAALAALLLVFLPRALFHASLACFDAPIMTLWLATVVAYWRGLDGRKWPWQAGVVFGLALATKHNALLLPFALGVHYVIAGVRSVSAKQLWGRGAAAIVREIVLHRWRVVVSLAVLGPLTLIAVWPWLWFDTYAHVKDWLVFHLTHVHYNFEYLGVNWNAPRFPWHVALVTTLYTVPVVTLAGAAVGAGVWVTRRGVDRSRAPAVLLALSAAASIGPFFLGTTPIFGAEKHWMPALPTICIAAGVGVAWAARGLARRVSARRAGPVCAACAAVIVLAAAVETVTAQPYALTWYNALAGGAPGGADRGMNRQFWGVAARGALPILARVAPAGVVGPAPVYAHDASPAWGFYQKLDQLPPTRPDAGHEQAGIARSQLAIVIHERHFNRHDYLIWSAYHTVQPRYVLRSAGVPIVSIYARPAR